MSSPEANKQLSMPERFAALNRVGTALFREVDEEHLLHLIAQTACELIGASFAAFTLRPVSEMGELLVPSEGNLFHLAAVVGVTEEQKALFRRMPLGGEGVLAPIFRHGVSVRIADLLTHTDQQQKRGAAALHARTEARDMAAAYAHGELAAEQLRSMGVPGGHPLIRSFLGAPLLDRDRQVRGGLLLGHEEPDRFAQEDEVLLISLASQAAVAIENGRLYRAAQMRVQEMQAIFESSVDAITLIDMQGKILQENEAAQRLREHLQQEAHGHEAIEQLFFAPARQVIATQQASQHPATIVQGDETHEYLVTASPLRPLRAYGETSPLIQHEATLPMGAVLVCHEVTEVRRFLAERQKRVETEKRFALLQQLLDELPISVYLVRGADARLVLANRATIAIWGAHWQQGQPMQQFLTDHHIRIFGIDGRPLEAQQLATQRAVQRGETIRHHQEVIRQPDGKTLPVLVNAVALHMLGLELLDGAVASTAGNEEEMMALVVHQDVTALKEAEQLKDDFIGIAAHELRTPVAVLKGFAQTLLVQSARHRGPELADWQVEALMNIDQATVRLEDMIDDLLDVSRIQGGRMTFTPQHFDLLALTRRIVTRFQLTNQNHQLSVRCDAEHFVVLLDPSRIEQVLTNIIGNAIKYSPRGGVIVNQFQEQTSEEVVLRVQDQGIGIPQAQQIKIFGRFSRADNALQHGIHGTGLGLYVCRELVEQQGGRIWFGSVEGKGTAFFIALPLATESDV